MKINKIKILIGYNNTNYNINIKKQNNKNNVPLKLILGVFIGFINGFFGGGGGMICVPALTNILKVPEKVAHATTILIILPMCILSCVIYFFKANIDFIFSLPIFIGFSVGGIIGAIVLKKISNTILKLIFNFVILIAGIMCIIF